MNLPHKHTEKGERLEGEQFLVTSEISQRLS